MNEPHVPSKVQQQMLNNCITVIKISILSENDSCLLTAGTWAEAKKCFIFVQVSTETDINEKYIMNLAAKKLISHMKN